MVVKYTLITKEERGQLGQRHKTIILLRVTPGAEPAPPGVAELTGEGFAG